MAKQQDLITRTPRLKPPLSVFNATRSILIENLVRAMAQQETPDRIQRYLRTQLPRGNRGFCGGLVSPPPRHCWGGGGVGTGVLRSSQEGMGIPGLWFR